MSNPIVGLYNSGIYVRGHDLIVDRWEQEWGLCEYPDDLKNVLHKYEDGGKVGNTVLDIGAGHKPLSFSLSTPERLILIDAAPQILALGKDGKEVIPLWANLDTLVDSGSFGFIKDYGPIDTIIASSVFNYVNWKKLLYVLANFHTDGGYLFIANLIGAGAPFLFSAHRPKSHSEIVETLPNCSYEVIDDIVESNLSMIVAKKTERL